MKGEDGKIKRGGLGEVCLSWWQDLENQRGGRNRLRRITDMEHTEEETDLRVYHDLRQRLQKAGYHNRANIRLCAAVLSHVKADNQQMPFASALAQNKVSEIRFRQVTSALTVEDLFYPLVRAVRQSKGEADVADLAESIIFWTDHTRNRWKEQYFDTLMKIEEKSR